MADENKIILEFPASGVELDLGETITFDDISGFLNTERLEGDFPMNRVTGDLPVNQIEDIDGILTAEEGHEIWNNS